ncbi:hypothetical protein PM082_015418 [Marasmius tenuissimus]|nr:hypothetical protein PM082_015418 [Marasmius tenuissimus]
MVLSQKTYHVLEDIKFFFTDSGAPPNLKDYTTLIAIHGFGVPGATFEAIQSHAHTYNLRIISLNRRDYAGSSPVSDEELAALGGKDESRAREFFDNMGLHLALFIKKFVEEEGIPPILESENGRGRGGIAVMGWSLGSMTAIAPFGNPGIMSDAVYQVLVKYVQGLILYDPAFSALGLSPPSNVNAAKLYSPGADPSVKGPADAYKAFIEWVSSHFQYTWQDGLPTPESIEEAGSLKRTESSVADSWTESDFEKYTDPKSTTRADAAIFAWSGIVKEMAQKALFDEKTASSFFPKLSITLLYAPHSIWMCLFAYMETKRLYEEHTGRDEAIRPIKFIGLDEGDHFAHFTQPEQFLQTIKSVVA